MFNYTVPYSVTLYLVFAWFNSLLKHNKDTRKLHLKLLHKPSFYASTCFDCLLQPSSSGCYSIIKTKTAYRISVNGKHTHTLACCDMYSISKIIQLNIIIKVLTETLECEKLSPDILLYQISPVFNGAGIQGFVNRCSLHESSCC